MDEYINTGNVLAIYQQIKKTKYKKELTAKIIFDIHHSIKLTDNDKVSMMKFLSQKLYKLPLAFDLNDREYIAECVKTSRMKSKYLKHAYRTNMMDVVRPFLEHKEKDKKYAAALLFFMDSNENEILIYLIKRNPNDFKKALILALEKSLDVNKLLELNFDKQEILRNHLINLNINLDLNLLNKYLNEYENEGFDFYNKILKKINDVELIKKIIEKFNIKDKSFLFKNVCERGLLDAVEYYLSLSDIDVNRSYRGMETPLEIACEKNNLPLVRLLVSKGANVTSGYNKAYRICKLNNFDDIADFLIQHGVDPNLKINKK